MKARILLLLSIVVFGCSDEPTVCECKKLVEEIQKSENKPTEPDDPRIIELKKCHNAHEKMTEEEKKEAKVEAQNCVE